jgi:nucleoside phosphorylase
MLDLSLNLGINLKEIKKTCVICPVSDHSLFSKLGKSKKNNLFFAKIMNYDNVTVISTKNNFLVGDIVLCLRNSECENIILFGSCGGIGDVKIADKLIVKKAFNFESFSEMLEMKRNPDSYYPSTILLENFLSKTKKDIKQVKCITSNSIVLQRTYKDWFDKNKINAVDMECSSVFSAASAINKKAIALFYVTDHVSEASPFETKLDEKQTAKLLAVRQELANSICDFINNNG